MHVEVDWVRDPSLQGFHAPVPVESAEPDDRSGVRRPDLFADTRVSVVVRRCSGDERVRST
jgi:hypothetical protein